MDGKLVTESAARIRVLPIEGATPLVVHVIHALRMGGMENGLVNLINGMDTACYRHAVVCASDFSDFRNRIRHPDVEVIALHKDDLSRAGLIRKLFACFRAWRPAIVHGRNWDGLDAMIPAWASGVPVRIQGEHGRDMHDLDGTNHRQQWLRRVNRPFTSHYTTVSRDLGDYLSQRVGIETSRITQIYNGVDTQRFHPAVGDRPALAGLERLSAQHFVVGTVGRLVPVKDQVTLIRACARLLQDDSRIADRLRLVIVGDGPLRETLEAEIRAAGLGGNAVLVGASEDVAGWLRGMDLFVLPSLAEGISNTLLEAMATGLPIVATDVGGNSDLVVEGGTGRMIRCGDTEALASCIRSYLENPSICRTHGMAARVRAQSSFSLGSMVERYRLLYDRLLSKAGIRHGRLERAA